MINSNDEHFRAFLLYQFDMYIVYTQSASDRFGIPLGHKIFGSFDNSLINPLRFTLVRYMYLKGISNPNVSVQSVDRIESHSPLADVAAVVTKLH